jgi:GNAT superfamily N-acetyltransferase
VERASRDQAAALPPETPGPHAGRPAAVERASRDQAAALPPETPGPHAGRPAAAERASCDQAAALPPETTDSHAGRPAAVAGGAGGFARRTNTALVAGDPGLPLADALDAVGAFAAAHRIPARVQVPTGSPWDRAVAAAGWVLDADRETDAEVAVLVGDLRRLAGPAEGVALAPRADDAWWELALGRAPRPGERRVLDPGTALPTAFGLLPGTGVVRAALVEDHLHLSRLYVRPNARRRGNGRALTAAAAGWGLAQGARWAVLQVGLHNEDARTFYAGLGCVEHHRYRYLVPP